MEETVLLDSIIIAYLNFGLLYASYKLWLSHKIGLLEGWFNSFNTIMDFEFAFVSLSFVFIVLVLLWWLDIVGGIFKAVFFRRSRFVWKATSKLTR